MTLYQRILQDDFATLPRVWQRFHSSPIGAGGHGVIPQRLRAFRREASEAQLGETEHLLS